MVLVAQRSLSPTQFNLAMADRLQAALLGDDAAELERALKVSTTAAGTTDASLLRAGVLKLATLQKSKPHQSIRLGANGSPPSNRLWQRRRSTVQPDRSRRTIRRQSQLQLRMAPATWRTAGKGAAERHGDRQNNGHAMSEDVFTFATSSSSAA